MSDIPQDILADFLSRVPARSLLQFRCVSKSWRAIIDSPHFIKMHLNRTLQTNSDPKLILCSGWNINLADFNEVEKTDTAIYTSVDLPFKRSGTITRLLGSCHGLLCLDANSDDTIVLWNPTTKKHLKLPFSDYGLYAKSSFYIWSLIYGFGYDKVSDDYKVLRIIQSYEGESEVKVFSMKSNSWREIGCFPYYLKYERAHGVLVAGALHWIVNRKPDSNMENLIAAFDLGTEEYRLVPGPNYSKIRGVDVTVKVLGESLCVVCNYYGLLYADIWVMKNYAVKESWTKLFTVPVSESKFVIKPLEYVTPLAYSKSGREVFMIEDCIEPFWYDLEKRNVRFSTICISDDPILWEHEMSFGSLVQLDGGISDSSVKVIDGTQAIGSQGTNKKEAIRKAMASCLRASSWCFKPFKLIAMGWSRVKMTWG